MGFGGKIKTIKNIEFTNIFDNNKSIFSQEIAIAMLITDNALDIVNYLVNKILLFTNSKITEKFGVKSEILLNKKFIEKGSVENYLKQKYGNSVILVHYTKCLYTADNCLFEHCYPNIYNDVIEHLTNIYNINQDTQIEINVNYYVCKGIYENNYIIEDNVEFNYSIQYHPFMINNKQYKISSVKPKYNNGVLYYVVNLENIDDSTDTISLNIEPPDVSNYYFVIFDDGGSLKLDLFDANQLITSSVNYTAIIYQIKHNGNFVVEDSKYYKAIYHKYGFISDLKKQLSSDIIKDVVITLVSNCNDDVVKDDMNSIYFNSTESIISNDYINIIYSQIDENNTKLSICENKNQKTTNCYNEIVNRNENKFIIPTNIIKKLPLRKKYDLLQKYSSLIISTEQDVKISWYQSGFISFLITAIVFSTGNPLLATMSIFTEIEKNRQLMNDNENIATVLSYIQYGITSYSGSNYFNINPIDIVNMLLKFINEYFTIKTKEIISEIDDINNKIEDNKNKYPHNGDFAYIDIVDTFYDTIYNLDDISYDYLYEKMYDYDKFFI